MTDRYKNIRKALADMDAAAEARNALAWRDAHARFVVHVAPDTISALLAERDALRHALEAMVEVGFGRAYVMDTARAALKLEEGK